MNSEIIAAYFECALWASTDDDDEPLDSGYDIADLSAEFRTQSAADIQEFIDGNSADAHAFIAKYGASQFGHSLWLSRNGHGAGFFDWPDEFAGRLQTAARSIGGRDLYIGDNGLIYAG